LVVRVRLYAIISEDRIHLHYTEGTVSAMRRTRKFDLRPHLDPTFICIIVADDVHFILREFDNAFPLELLDGLYDTCMNYQCKVESVYAKVHDKRSQRSLLLRGTASLGDCGWKQFNMLPIIRHCHVTDKGLFP